MQRLDVALGDRSYPIYIGAGLLRQAADLVGAGLSKQTLIVSNTVVAPLYLEKLLGGLPDITTRPIIVADGEQHKTLKTLNAIITRLLEERFNRTCTLVALGGGVIGDVTGFAAACYQRGVNYVQVPTTLLAQVDSAVGGKTAVNHRLGKNMIGAFHQPVAVISDTDTLATLPARELRAGMAEIIKYGLINDSEFFIWLEENMDGLLRREPACLAHAIEVSCRNKASIVARDEREDGVRALLNLGHTFGHAIETALNYGTWLHGEAVAAGTSMAARLSVSATGFPAAAARRVNALLEKAELPTTLPPGISREQLRELMSVDKKARHGQLRLVLLEEIGRAVVTQDFEEADLEATLARYTG